MPTVRIELPDGEWLQGLWAPADGLPGAAVVYVHGFGSTHDGEKARAVADECERRAWNFAAFDFRSHGTSSGRLRDLRPSRLQADLDAVSRFLAERGVTRLFLYGSSMGGFASAWFAARRPELVAAVALVAPAFHFASARLDQLTPEQVATWRREGVLTVTNAWLKGVELGYGLVEEAPQFAAAELHRTFHTPALIFHGLRDDTVPPTLSVAFQAAVATPDVELRLYKDGDHRLTDRKAELAAAACDFFARRGAAAPAACR